MSNNSGVKITVTGANEIIAKFENADKTIMPFLKQEADKMALVIVGDAGKYPPASSANQPGRTDPDTGRPLGFYQRGVGMFMPTGEKFKTKSNMKKTKINAGFGTETTIQAYKLVSHSEQLKNSWTIKGKETSGGLLETIGNNASYFDYVHGDKQSDLFAKRGWKKLQIDNYKDLIRKTVENAVKAWKASTAK